MEPRRIVQRLCARCYRVFRCLEGSAADGDRLCTGCHVTEVMLADAAPQLPHAPGADQEPAGGQG